MIILKYIKIIMNNLMALLGIDKNYLHEIGITNDDLIENNDYDSEMEDDRPLEELNKKENRPKHPKKINKLEISPLFKDDESYAEAPNDFLMKPPFSLILVGIRGAGKTTLCARVLEPYANYFDSVYCFSPTAKLDISFKKMAELLKIDDKNIFNKYSESRLTKLMKMIKNKNKNIPQKDKHRVLIILEDIIDDLPRAMNKSVMNKLAFNSRHYSISFVILSQYFKKIPIKIRNNTTSWAIYRMENTIEKKKIIQELSGSLGKDYFEQILDDATEEPYTALTINYQKKNPYRYTKNFNETIMDI